MWGVYVGGDLGVNNNAGTARVKGKGSGLWCLTCCAVCAASFFFGCTEYIARYGTIWWERVESSRTVRFYVKVWWGMLLSSTHAQART